MKYAIVGTADAAAATDTKALVFLHGWGCDETTMQSLSGEFPQHKCILFSLHSIESSNKVLSIDDYALAVIETLKQEKIENAVFFVHSFGGRVIAKIWSMRPELITRIIFLNSAGIRPRFKLKRWIKKIRYKFRRRLGLNTDKFGSVDYKKLRSAGKKTFSNIINERLEEIYKTITVPSLIIAGKSDRETPPYMAIKLHKLIRGSTLKILPRCGHFCFLDQPHEVKMLAQFFVNM